MTSYNSIFPALLDLDEKQIPIFVPTFNQPSLLKMTIDQAKSLNNEVVIYDNNSTYLEMIDYLHELSKDYKVIFSNTNTGPRIFTEDLQILSIMPEKFIVSDPDLIYNNELPENFIDEMIQTLNKYKLAKVGFAIEIKDKEETDRFLNLEKVLEWECPYWENELGMTKTKDAIYSAYIDTTFSLNDRNSCVYHRRFNKPTWRYPSARIAGRYTCRHIGWWKKELMPQSAEEIKNYLATQKWSHTENHYYKDVQ